jgi:hypothetical protein
MPSNTDGAGGSVVELLQGGDQLDGAYMCVGAGTGSGGLCSPVGLPGRGRGGAPLQLDLADGKSRRRGGSRGTKATTNPTRQIGGGSPRIEAPTSSLVLPGPRPLAWYRSSCAPSAKALWMRRKLMGSQISRGALWRSTADGERKQRRRAICSETGRLFTVYLGRPQTAAHDNEEMTKKTTTYLLPLLVFVTHKYQFCGSAATDCTDCPDLLVLVF